MRRVTSGWATIRPETRSRFRERHLSQLDVLAHSADGARLPFKLIPRITKTVATIANTSRFGAASVQSSPCVPHLQTQRGASSCWRDEQDGAPLASRSADQGPNLAADPS
jgi:hypothetical protein